MKTTFAILASTTLTSAAESPMESFIQTDLALSERLKMAEAEASQKAKAAEEAWQKSRKETDLLLAKVHSEMATLNGDLKKSAEKQKQDLAMLESSRQKESEALRETEKKLQDLQKHSKIQVPASSFIQNDDYLEPLRKAAEAAKNFAEKIRAQTAGAEQSSLLQEGAGTEDFAAKAQHSLSLAQQALKKLDEDIATQKQDLEIETEKAKKDEEALRAAAHISFLQLGENIDPLSPKALNEWREKFQAELQRARAAAGITTPFHSSFAQLDTSTDEKLKEDELKVARLQEAYDAQMAKLKQDNADLMAQAHAEIEKAKEMKSKLEADMRASSFVETKGSFDVEKEQEHIKELQRKWEREVSQLGQKTEPSKAELELNALIEQQKVKEAAAQNELEKLKQKLNKDIELMHQDMAVNSIGTRASFIHERSKSKDVVDVLKSAATGIADTVGGWFSGSRPADPEAVVVAPVHESTGTTEILAQTSEPVAIEKPILALSTPVEVSAATEPVVAEKPILALAAVADAAATAPSSFIQVKNNDPAQLALAKAEEDLHKLQEQLREQSANLASFASKQ